MMNLLRRIASLPGLRRVLLVPRVRRTVARLLALRFLAGALAVTQPARLVLGEVFARGQVRDYMIRGSGVPVSMMHGRDLEALSEIFRGGEYDPPAELVERLANVRRVVDVGANVGMFSAWSRSRWPGVELVAFEPMPENTIVYRRWAAAAGGQVGLIEAAAAPEMGELPFLSGLGAGDQQVDAAAAAIVVPAVDLFPYLAGADLVKIDIEGGEWAILADPRMADLDVVLVMEFHRVGAPSLPAAEAARGLLETAGFAVGAIRRNYWGHGTLWAWR